MFGPKIKSILEKINIEERIINNNLTKFLLREKWYLSKQWTIIAKLR